MHDPGDFPERRISLEAEPLDHCHERAVLSPVRKLRVRDVEVKFTGTAPSRCNLRQVRTRKEAGLGGDLLRLLSPRGYPLDRLSLQGLMKLRRSQGIVPRQS